MSESTPEGPRSVRAAAHDAPAYDDEISLRELYLILRRGLALILGVALVAGAAAFLYATVAPDQYEAEASVLSSPSTVRVRDQGTLQFEPGDAIGFDAYETIATSRAVFERTLQSLDDLPAQQNLGYRALANVADLERVASPTGDGATPLIVAHRIGWSDAEHAAAFTNAWTQATVEQVRETLLANLAPTQEDTAATVERRRGELDVLESEWESFQARDPRAELRTRLEGLAERRAANDARRDRLERQMADARGRLAALGRTPADVLDEASLQLLRTRGNDVGVAAVGVDPDEALQASEQWLLQSPNASTLADLAAADLAGALGELRATERVAERFDAQGDTLRTRLAELERRGAELERRVEQAREAYTSVAELQPLIDYVADLTPGNIRVINEAQPPEEAIGPRTLLITALTAVVAGMLATLFVFLREAVREPDAPKTRPREDRPAAEGAPGA